MNKTIHSFMLVLIISGVLFTACGQVAVDSVPVEEKKVVEQDAAKTEEKKVSEKEVVSAVYADGTYEISGDYLSPAGAEKIGFKLVVKGDVVQDLVVTPKAENKASQQYQGLFVKGVNKLVVGKKISDIGPLPAVNGSSLTPKGFDDALAKLKVEAAK